MPKLSNIRFTENTVKVNKPKDKVYELRDSGLQGLILRIQPTGKKTWRVALNRNMRRGEVLGLKWDQVNLGSNPRVTVTASYAKSNETRHIPLNSEAVAVLKKWKAQGTSSGWVFPSPKTGHRLRDLKKSWTFLLVKADIQGFRFHDLRHDFASRLVVAGIDLYRVKDLLGHSTIQMTEKYSQLAPAALAVCRT